MPAHRLTVRNHAFAFGYSLATMIVYQKLLSFERCRSDTSGAEPDNLTAGEGSGVHWVNRGKYQTRKNIFENKKIIPANSSQD
jgi:hypothetical protein